MVFSYMFLSRSSYPMSFTLLLPMIFPYFQFIPGFRRSMLFLVARCVFVLRLLFCIFIFQFYHLILHMCPNYLNCPLVIILFIGSICKFRLYVSFFMRYLLVLFSMFFRNIISLHSPLFCVFHFSLFTLLFPLALPSFQSMLSSSC